MERTDRATLHRSLQWGYMAVLTAVYAGIRLYLFAGVKPITFYDSAGYLQPPFTWRPFAVPLIYMLLGDRTDRIVWFQVGFSALCWSILAWTVCFFARDPLLRGILPTVILAFSLSHVIAQWDATILSESLSFSFFAALIALSLGIGKRIAQRRRINGTLWAVSLLVWVPLAVLFLNTRDTNLYLVPFAIVLVWIFLWRTAGGRTLAALLTAALIAACVWQQGDADAKHRWGPSLAGLIAKRILPHPEATAFFVQRGMPIDPALLRRGGPVAADQILRHPGFVPWLWSRGRQTYTAYLLSRPFESQAEVVDHMEKSLDAAALRPYAANGALRWDSQGVDGLPTWLDERFFFHVHHPWSWLAALVALPAVMFLADPARRRLYGLTLLTVAAFDSQLFVAYHGDTIELERHSLFGNVLFRTAVLLTLVDGYVFSRAWFDPVKKTRREPRRPP
ncbi:MAG: hypothetical protein QJR01_07970 [Kyrpidia sp.]|nr:hypothetical protein [Kyrpidia sp.]